MFKKGSSKPARDTGSAILVVCNEPTTAPIWGYLIREQKLHTILETSPQNALAFCEENKPALVILDLNLAHDDRVELCGRMRQLVANPLLIFISGYDEACIADYYAAGVDDCVVKPISPVIFKAKVKAWLRHSQMLPVPAMQSLTVAGMVLEPEQRVLKTPDGHRINLTELEARLLHLLMSKPGHTFDNEYIVSKVWGLHGAQDLGLLKHPIYRLRRKLEDDPEHPRWIRSWYGKGYSFGSD